MVKDGYKETALGTIPEDWILYKLEEIISINQGNALSTKSHKDDGYPVFGANGQIGYYNEFSHLNSEVLLTCRGSTCGTINKSKPKSYITNNSMVLSPKEKKEINKEFLYYIMKKVNYSKFITGTGQPQITKTEIKSAQIPIPEVKEQKKIASILSSVDKSIKKTDEVIEETKELKKGLMQELLTKGIGHSEFKESQFGKIPKSWKIEPLNKIAEVTGGNTPRRSTEEYWGGDIPWLTPSQLTGEIINEIDKTDEYITEKGFENSSVKLLPVGTVMLTSRATIGETVINKVPMTTNQGFANIICKDDKLFNYFVLYLLRYLTPKLEALAGGSTFLEISRTSVRSLNIPVPPLEEQKKIASILSSVDNKIKKEEEYKAKLEQLKKGLMQKLLTGEIRVNTDMEV